MKPEDVYISPQGKVLVTNYSQIPSILGLPKPYRLEVGKWYKLGQKAIAPNANDFIDVIHQDGKSIPHKPEHFMSKMEWRQKQLDSILKVEPHQNHHTLDK